MHSGSEEQPSQHGKVAGGVERGRELWEDRDALEGGREGAFQR